jgi:hypothetical protein
MMASSRFASSVRWLGAIAFGMGVQSSRQVDAAAQQKCPADMVLVSGSYCPLVEQRCLRWLDDSKLPFARCAVYAEPARCLVRKIALRFCIDRYEYTPPSARLPLNFASFAQASAVCTRLGRRTCNEEEWNLACEGEAMQPYPYGFERLPVCNQDRRDLYADPEHRTVLRDLREPSNARPACVSPFGVFNMAGNLDEPVRRRGGSAPFRNALKGGWWMPSQNRCRFATTAHDDYYRGIQIGVRCCSEAGPR